MSETTGVTVSNFLAGVIVLGVALVVIPNIVENQLGAASSSSNTNSLGQLAEKVNQTCDGTVETAEGTLELSGDALINLKQDEVILRPDNGEDVTRSVSCSIRESITFTGTAVYTIEKVDGGEYDVR